ncbi:hypothetical protein SAMN05880558_11335 [Aeromonas sp. RU39B]|uniref:hypothetical protein n=1 Tax=Aeromonas sp. RU39B TaxID=1907416 RepID=UPI000955E02D|nr:hypothetical protein [Aeromonas sp. RU39B]SIR40284.1 hypothetical protein SAMN05880558_11335 [Aeromonas sp. RU39B]
MGLIQNMQAAQWSQGQPGGDQMHASMMQMLEAALMGDGGEAVAGRLGAGKDKVQGVADAVAGGIYAILKQAKEAGRQVPAQQIVKAVYVGCREMLSTGQITDPESKIDALFRAMDRLKRMDADQDVIDDQILAEAGQLLEQIAQQAGNDEQPAQGAAA